MTTKPGPVTPVTSPPSAGLRSEIDWSTVLIWLMRALSVAMLLRGVLNWSVMIGVTEPNGTAFEDQPLAIQVGTVTFAVLDLVAGVGLWIGAVWGGALWLIASLVLVGVDVAGFAGAANWAAVLARPWPLTAVDVGLIALYLTVSLKASAQQDRLDPQQRSRPAAAA